MLVDFTDKKEDEEGRVISLKSHRKNRKI